MMRALAAAAVGLALLGGTGVWLGLRQLAPVAEQGEPRVYVVPAGAGLSRIAPDLEREGIVRSALALRLLARVRGVENALKAGEYELSPEWPARVVLARLTTGRTKTYAVSIPEGLRANEIAERLEAADIVDGRAFLERVFDPELARELGLPGESLEGYLFPETYRFARRTPPRAVIESFLRQFFAAWNEVEAKARERGMSMHEVVTLASIVEKETGAAEERPLIAAVFHNRLRRGMRLETDPAVIYGIPDFDGNLRRVHLRDTANPYNTYKFAGLPPGPIASPGLDSLRAVVEPAASDYLYFVSKNDGTHHFSRTYREHANAVNRFQKNRQNRRRAR